MNPASFSTLSTWHASIPRPVNTDYNVATYIGATLESVSPFIVGDVVSQVSSCASGVIMTSTSNYITVAPINDYVFTLGTLSTPTYTVTISAVSPSAYGTACESMNKLTERTQYLKDSIASMAASASMGYFVSGGGTFYGWITLPGCDFWYTPISNRTNIIFKTSGDKTYYPTYTHVYLYVNEWSRDASYHTGTYGDGFVNTFTHCLLDSFPCTPGVPIRIRIEERNGAGSSNAYKLLVWSS